MVPSGTIVLSQTASNAALAGAGFAAITSTNFTIGTNWVQATSAAPWSARDSFGAVTLNGLIWVMGGYGNSGVLNDVWSSPDGTNWTEVTSAAPWGARDGFGAVTLNGQMWIMGGETNYLSGTKNDVWSSLDGTNWTCATSAAPWTGREFFWSVASNGQLWVLGGQVSSSGFLNDVWYSQVATIVSNSMLGPYYLFQKQ
jgi:hypothetical protein